MPPSRSGLLSEAWCLLVGLKGARGTRQGSPSPPLLHYAVEIMIILGKLSWTVPVMVLAPTTVFDEFETGKNTPRTAFWDWAAAVFVWVDASCPSTVEPTKP